MSPAGYRILILIFYRCWLVVVVVTSEHVESGAASGAGIGAGVRGLSCPAPACTNSTNRG